MEGLFEDEKNSSTSLMKPKNKTNKMEWKALKSIKQIKWNGTLLRAYRCIFIAQ
jgi:hypothetical protein